jgi:hypothetical protein
MKHKPDFRRLIGFLLAILIVSGAVAVQGQVSRTTPCSRITDAQIAAKIKIKIAAVRRANPARHISVSVSVWKKTVVLVTGKTRTIYVNEIVRYAESLACVKRVKPRVICPMDKSGPSSCPVHFVWCINRCMPCGECGPYKKN